MNKLALIISDGFEEIEAVVTLDVLRRAGINVEVLGLDNINCTGAHGITIICDEIFEYYNSLDYDGIVFVGGMKNAENLASSKTILDLIEYYNDDNKLIAGICATPSVVFSKTTILNGKQATCYPSDDLIENISESFVDKNAVISNNVITSQSPATVFEYALMIVSALGLDSKSVLNGLKGKTV